MHVIYGEHALIIVIFIMEYRQRIIKDSRQIFFKGKFSLSDSKKFIPINNLLQREDIRKITFDFKEMEEMEVAAIAIIAIFAKKAKEKGKVFSFVNLRRNIASHFSYYNIETDMNSVLQNQQVVINKEENQQTTGSPPQKP